MWINGLHRIRWRRVAVSRGHRTRRVSFRKRLNIQIYTNIQQSWVVKGVKMSANGLHRIRWCLLCAWLRLARTDEGFCRQPSRRCVLLTQAGGPFAEHWTILGGLFFTQLRSSRDYDCVPKRSRQIPTLYRWPCALFDTITSKCFKLEIESCPYVHQKKV